MTVVLDRPSQLAGAADGTYYQCAMYQGPQRTVGWIEARGAKVGARVELKGEAGLWTVDAVYQPSRTITWLREKQRNDRNSLKSIWGHGKKSK